MRIQRAYRRISTRTSNSKRVENGNYVNEPWTSSSLSHASYDDSLIGQGIIKSQQQNHVFEGYQSTFLKPYLFHMRCCGLYFDDVMPAGEQSPPRNFWKIYSFVIVVLNFINFSLFLTPTLVKISDMGFGDIAMMSCMIMWTLQNCITSSTCFYICSSGRFHREFLRKWYPLYAWGSDPTTPVPKTLLRWVRAMLHSVLITNFINVADYYLFTFCIIWKVVRQGVNDGHGNKCLSEAYAIGNFPNKFVYGVFLVLFFGWFFLCFDFISGGIGLKFFPLVSVLDETTVHYLVKVWGVLSIICTPAWTFPTGLFVLTALSLMTLFSNFNDKLRRAARDAGATSGFNVEAFRLQNERLIVMVEVADRLFGVYIFATFVTTLFLTSLVVYRTLFYCSLGWLKAIEIFWFIAQFGILLVISYVSAEVNTVAHQSLGELYSLSTQYASCKGVLQMSLFIDRLTTMTVGFSGWGFFFINRSFILTLVSGFFTYFFLLLQFGGEVPSRAMCMMNSTFGGNKTVS